jgi:hypothetical protein
MKLVVGSVGFLLGLLFGPENGRDMILLYVGRLLRHYTLLCPRR